MTLRIEDYALIGDCETAALVGRNGSIDWLCWPRFDSGACFAALLGTPEHGRWLIAPVDGAATVRRRYRAGTMVLDTEWLSGGGSAQVTDFMPVRAGPSHVVRIVSGLKGEVNLRMELVLRFDYGSTVPWVEQLPDGPGVRAIAGPDMAPAALDGAGARRKPLHGRRVHAARRTAGDLRALVRSIPRTAAARIRCPGGAGGN